MHAEIRRVNKPLHTSLLLEIYAWYSLRSIYTSDFRTRFRINLFYIKGAECSNLFHWFPLTNWRLIFAWRRCPKKQFREWQNSSSAEGSFFVEAYEKGDTTLSKTFHGITTPIRTWRNVSKFSRYAKRAFWKVFDKQGLLNYSCC